MKNISKNNWVILFPAIILNLGLHIYVMFRYKLYIHVNDRTLRIFILFIPLSIFLVICMYYIFQYKPKISIIIGLLLLLLGATSLYLLFTPEKTRLFINYGLYYLSIIYFYDMFISGITILLLIILLKIVE